MVIRNGADRRLLMLTPRNPDSTTTQLLSPFRSLALLLQEVRFATCHSFASNLSWGRVHIIVHVMLTTYAPAYRGHPLDSINRCPSPQIGPSYDDQGLHRRSRPPGS